VPRLEVLRSADIMQRLSTATDRRMVASCHDLSDGGLGVALAEMAFSGGFGATADLAKIPTGEQIDSDAVLLFSQSNSRFLCEIEPGNSSEFEKLFCDVPIACIGKVTEGPRLVIVNSSGITVIDEDIARLKEAWQQPLNW